MAMKLKDARDFIADEAYSLAEVRRPRVPDRLYHATFKFSADRIEAEGIKPQEIRLWNLPRDQKHKRVYADVRPDRAEFFCVMAFFNLFFKGGDRNEMTGDDSILKKSQDDFAIVVFEIATSSTGHWTFDAHEEIWFTPNPIESSRITAIQTRSIREALTDPRNSFLVDKEEVDAVLGTMS